MAIQPITTQPNEHRPEMRCSRQLRPISFLSFQLLAGKDIPIVSGFQKKAGESPSFLLARTRSAGKN
jgi:hypothetical protein